MRDSRSRSPDEVKLPRGTVKEKEVVVCVENQEFDHPFYGAVRRFSFLVKDYSEPEMRKLTDAEKVNLQEVAAQMQALHENASVSIHTIEKKAETLG